MLNYLETGNQLKVDRKEVTRGQEKGIRGEGWMSTKTAENSSSKTAVMWEMLQVLLAASSTEICSSKQFLLPVSLNTSRCVVR